MSVYFRPRFHLAPPSGRLNDPNGLYVEDGVLHAYYQHDPQWPTAEKRTGWGHASTPLLSDKPELWTHHPDALYPAVDYDDKGCYSGSAVLVNGELELFYTGNAKPGGHRRATQNIVHVGGRRRADGGTYLRSERNPLIDGPAPGFTNHYRDPHVLWREDHWLMVLGAQRDNETGSVVLYTSEDRRAWDYAGEIQFDTSSAVLGGAPDMIPGGYMWECPNLVTLRDDVTGEDMDVLIVLPQGLEQVGDHYATNHQCGYVVGHLQGTTFTVSRGFTELDYGHEFYAPQVVHGAQPPLMLGWMGLPDLDDQPTRQDGWVHTLTVARELHLSDGVLRQVPRASISSNNADSDLEVGASFEWSGEMPPGSELVLVDTAGDAVARLSVNGNVVELDRQDQQYHAGGDVRRACLRGVTSAVDVRVLVDASCLEIFIDEGRISFASRIFPRHEPNECIVRVLT